MAGINKNFVVKHGLQVNDNLIVADGSAYRVGVGTTAPKYLLHAYGGIGVTDAVISGIATVYSLKLPGTVSAGSSDGVAGQYLVNVGTGVTWQNLPNFRTTQTFTAVSTQTNFVFNYTIGLIDVYVNGVKLSSTEYAAPDGANVSLNSPCFGGETVELISYSSVNPGYAFTGIYGLTVQEEGSTVGTLGQVVSLNFVGASVTATASGAGATVYINGSTSGTSSQWVTTAAGIHTLSNVGIGTTNPTSALTVTGNVLISGITTTQKLNVGTGGTVITTTSDGLVGIGTTDPGYADYAGNGAFPVTLPSSKLTVGSVGTSSTSLVVNGKAFINGIDIHSGAGPQGDAFFGWRAGKLSYSGTLNSAFGAAALTTPNGAWCSAFGNSALQVATGNSNSAFGSNAGASVTSGGNNTLIGRASGAYLTSGSGNTLVGYYAGSGSLNSITTNNTYLGNQSGVAMESGSSNTIIGAFNGNQNGLNIRSSSNNVVLSDGDGNVRFYANSSGNVGIGTTNPQYTLQVGGSTRVGINTSQGVILTSPNGTKYQLFVENDGTLKTITV